MNRKGQGRKPKPTALKVIDGRTKATRIEPDFPEVELNPQPPMPLQGSALTEWQRVIDELVSIHLVTQMDLGILCLYCIAYGRAQDAYEAMLQEYDPKCLPFMGMRDHPMAIVHMKAAAEAVKYAAEFGLTPSSRTRLEIKLPDVKKNKVTKYF